MSKTQPKKETGNTDLIKEVKNLAKSERNLETELAREIRLLSVEIKNIKSMEVIKVFRHPWKFLWFSFLKGIMVGFGSVLGATVFLSIFVYLLAQISLVPFVGDFVESVMNEIETGAPTKTQSDGPGGLFEQYQQAKNDLGNNS